MPVFAVTYRYGAGTDAVRDEVRPAHRAWLAEQNAAGRVLASGPKPGKPEALLVWSAQDEAELEGFLANDPFAAASVIDRTTIEAWDPVIGPWG